MTTKDERTRKRKSVVEAIIIRHEPVHLVARIYKIPERTVFDWLSRYRSGGLASARRQFSIWPPKKIIRR